jgi:hypothetical protein
MGHFTIFDPGWLFLSLRMCDNRQGMDWISYLLITFIHHWELHFTVHWHTQTSVLSITVSTNRFLAMASTEGDSSASCAQVLFVTAAHAQLLSTDNSANWVPCWQPFHTTLLVFSSQPDFQLNSLTLTNQEAGWVKSVNYEAPDFAVLSNLLLFPPS